MRTVAAVARPSMTGFSLEEVELEEPREHEVVVEMVASGLCHTDLSARDGKTPFPLPGVLGHEGAGIVSAVGGGSDLDVGQPVLLTFTSCGSCPMCRADRPAYCREFGSRNFGGRRPDGSALIHDKDHRELAARFLGQSCFASHALVDYRSIVPIDADPAAELAHLAPLGCGVQTGVGSILNELEPGPDDRVVIFGVGAVGLCAVIAAAMTGVRRVVAVDFIEARLELAKSLGASEVMTPTEFDEVSGLEASGEFDFALECSGSPQALETALKATNSTGVTAVVGAPPPGTTVPIDVNRIKRGRTVRGITEGGSNPRVFIPRLVEMVRKGDLPMDRLVALYRFPQIEEAAQDAHSGEVVKPVVTFDSVGAA